MQGQCERRRGEGNRFHHGLLLAVAAALAGCSFGQAEAPRIDVEYGGCGAVLEPGPVCVLGQRPEIRIWVGARPGDEVAVLVDGRRVDVAARTVRAGLQIPLTVPGHARRVEVHASGRPVWSLAVAAAGSPPIGGAGAREAAGRDLIGEVRATARRIDDSIRARDLAAVRAALDGLRLPPAAPAECRYLAAYYRGLLSEREGDYRSALAHVRSAVEIAERVGLDRYRWLAEEELALLLRGLGRSREAAQAFERLRQESGAGGRRDVAQLLNNQAWSMLLGREAGERLPDPTPLLLEALATYEASPAATIEQKANARINLALAHLQEGRIEEARQVLSQARALAPHPPLSHALWLLDLEARIAALEGDPGRALQRFAELAERAVETGSGDARLRAALGTARAQIAIGHREEALGTLQGAQRVLDQQSQLVPMHEGREGFLAARQAIVDLHLDLLLSRDRSAEALQVALRSRSRVLRQLAQADRLAGMTSAERTRRARLIGEFQRRRFALEARASDEWKLPVDRVEHERAARHAEAEALEGLLDEAFQLLGEPGLESQPPQPRPAGELTLVYHPLRDEWVGFAADERGVRAHRFGLEPASAEPPEQLAAKMLLPFHEMLERARRIRVLASGDLANVDVHALPMDGEPLLAGRPVVYGLGLPRPRPESRPAGGRALLVTDPRGDLPGALREAREVRATLAASARPWSTEELRGGAASVEAVRTRLAVVDLLHYAGHGSYSGSGGWESSFLLAADTRLTVSDVLALDVVPSWVMLSGCDTGRSAVESPVASLGLAQAFLLAGSQAVVATTAPAADRAVPDFSTELYRQWDRTPDLAVALQRAQLAWRRRSGRSDWAGFRLLEP